MASGIPFKEICSIVSIRADIQMDQKMVVLFLLLRWSRGEEVPIWQDNERENYLLNSVHELCKIIAIYKSILNVQELLLFRLEMRFSDIFIVFLQRFSSIFR